MRVSTGTGQKGRTDSSAVSRGGALDPGGVWTLPHEHHQLCRESQGRLLPLTARLSTGSPPHCIPSQLWGGGRESWVTLRRVTDPPPPRVSCPEARWAHLSSEGLNVDLGKPGAAGITDRFWVCSDCSWRTNGQRASPLFGFLTALTCPVVVMGRKWLSARWCPTETFSSQYFPHYQCWIFFSSLCSSFYAFPFWDLGGENKSCIFYVIICAYCRHRMCIFWYLFWQIFVINLWTLILSV